jgi:hypothetical protein
VKKIEVNAMMRDTESIATRQASPYLSPSLLLFYSLVIQLLLTFPSSLLPPDKTDMQMLGQPCTRFFELVCRKARQMIFLRDDLKKDKSCFSKKYNV